MRFVSIREGRRVTKEKERAGRTQVPERRDWGSSWMRLQEVSQKNVGRANEGATEAQREKDLSRSGSWGSTGRGKDPLGCQGAVQERGKVRSDAF